MKKLLLLLLLFISLITQATTYYIRTDGSNGNTGLGNTSGTAWQTLAYACANAGSGNTVHVTAGTYAFSTSITVPTGVSIEGDGVTSILSSSVTGSRSDEHWTLDLYNGTLGSGSQHISGIKINGNNTAYAAIRIERRNNVEIYNCTFIDCTDWGVCYRGLYAGFVEPTVWATGNSFHDNTVTNCSAYYWNGSGDVRNDGSGNGLLEITEQQGMRVYNNILTQNSRTTWHNGWCIKAIAGYDRDLKIYNNTMTKQAWNGTAGIATWDFAIEMWQVRGGIEIYDNTFVNGSLDFSGGGSAGVATTQKGSYAYALWIHDNTIGQTALTAYEGTTGVYIEQSATDVIIERNYISNVYQGITFNLGVESGSGTPLSNIYVRYNVMNAIGVSGSNDGYGICFPSTVNYAMSGSNIQLYNNTIIGNPSQTEVYGIMLPACGTITNVYVRNNIIQKFSAGIRCNAIGTIDYAWVQYNDLYLCGNSNAPSYALTPTHLTSENGYAGNIPPFVSSSNFNLTTSKNGVYMTPISGFTTTDMNGVVPGSLPDIGAYEYGSITIPTVTTSAITSITANSAAGGGNVTSDGGASVTAKGTVIDLYTNPTLVNRTTVDGTGTGSFTSSLLALYASHSYYVRAYATNSQGTAYGSNFQFTTLASITAPSVTTALAVSLTNNGAMFGGTVTSNGGDNNARAGVTIASFIHPTLYVADLITNSYSINDTHNPFGLSVSGLLAPLTVYYYRAWIVNSVDTAYGAEYSIKTLGYPQTIFYKCNGKFVKSSGKFNITH